MEKNNKLFCYKVNRSGYLFIGIGLAATILGGGIWSPLGWIAFIFTIFCVGFFRDPDRVTPDSDKLIISPADGLVQQITKVPPPSELGLIKNEQRVRISIFLNILDVHINRIPISGKIEKIKYVHGKFFHAALDKASKHNERNLILIKTKTGKDIIFTQIAGLVARRIVCHVKTGQNVLAGERYGLIKFGSRVDVYLPKGETPKVSIGQRVVGGETVLSILGDHSSIDNCVVR